VIEQALFAAKDGGGYTCLARSPGFRDSWLPEVEKLCAGFGDPAATVACPSSLFALPLDRRHVIVGRAAGQGNEGVGPLAFHLLVVPKSFYADLHGDLFLIAGAYPPPWGETRELPVLTWTAGPPPRRTVADVQAILDVPYSATLLGGAQALLDGGRLVFERSAPDDRIIRALWALLPVSNRCELWPATFAFGNALGFDVVVVPRAEGPAYAHCVMEAQAGDYPERRYERALQIAAESGDQEALDRLFARRSQGQTIRIGLIVLALFLALPVIGFLFGPPPPPPTTAASTDTNDRQNPVMEAKP
jgi:hypothetical protein